MTGYINFYRLSVTRVGMFIRVNLSGRKLDPGVMTWLEKQGLESLLHHRAVCGEWTDATEIACNYVKTLIDNLGRSSPA